jgi:polysaccharide pyruvyl transferase WcaK-like protein
MRRANCFLLGGGNLLQNETSDRSLFYYTQLLALARQAGCKNILYGGIGALDDSGRERVRRALPFLDGALLRTPADMAKLRALGGRMPMQLLPDGALFLRDMPRRAAAAGAPILLVTLCGRGEDDGAYDAALSLCRRAKEVCDAQILLSGMHKAQDTQALSRFAEALGGAEILEVESGEELIAALSTVSLCFSSRLHPLILSAVAGTPAIAWGKSEKIADFVSYAAACERELGCEGEMLFHAKGKENEAALFAVAERRLREGMAEEGALAYLRALRGGEEDFSFLDFYEKL